PAGWVPIDLQGTSSTWVRSTAQYHTGAACMIMDFDYPIGEDWLILPKFSVVSTDSFVFWLTPHWPGYLDSLSVRVSTTDSSLGSFTNTILDISDLEYPDTSGVWKRFAVSLSAFAGQDVFVGFRHYDETGDGIYVDDVAIGTQPTTDALSFSLDMKQNIGPVSVSPSASFQNLGSAVQTFNVTMTITGG